MHVGTACAALGHVLDVEMMSYRQVIRSSCLDSFHFHGVRSPTGHSWSLEAEDKEWLKNDFGCTYGREMSTAWMNLRHMLFACRIPLQRSRLSFCGNSQSLYDETYRDSRFTSIQSPAVVALLPGNLSNEVWRSDDKVSSEQKPWLLRIYPMTDP